MAHIKISFFFVADFDLFVLFTEKFLFLLMSVNMHSLSIDYMCSGLEIEWLIDQTTNVGET